MRLIDIDKHFESNEVFYSVDLKVPLHEVKEVLEHAPTVEAIPIAFIKEYVEYQDTEEKKVLRMMWHAWELCEKRKWEKENVAD